MSVPSNLIPTRISQLNEYTGLDANGYLPYIVGGVTYKVKFSTLNVAGTGVTSFSGGTTGLTPSTPTNGAVTLGGTLALANGGTGATTASGARTALGLGTAATTNSTAYATAAQGTKADTAVQTVSSADGSVVVTGTTAIDLAVAASTNMIVRVRNATGSTLTKGTVVYITGATGQIPTVSKAQANSDATSAQTLGLISADLANNTNGNVTVIGRVSNVDTSAFTDGQQLYLSGAVAGAMTATKPYAPTHIVYVAVVEYAHPTQGSLFVKVQNGYELDEIHNVSAQSPSNGQTIVYNSSTSLWEKNTVSLSAGVNGTLPVASGGTGQTTYTDGQLLIGNTTGNTLTKATLTAGSGISITNGTGSITIAATSSGPSLAQVVAMASAL
ncbi:MAG: hypothetical protein RI988_3435 [Pseudomonadota bacterium]|jgi:hypothetical protein